MRAGKVTQGRTCKFYHVVTINLVNVVVGLGLISRAVCALIALYLCSQRKRRLRNIVNELMTTEQQYVKRLGVLVTVSVDVTCVR